MNELTLGDVAHVVMGQSPDGRTYNKDGEGTPLLNGPVEFGQKYPIAVQWTTEPSKFAEPGDILFCVRGNTLGRQNLADRAYAIGRGLAAIRAKANEAETEYLGFWLQFKAKSILDAGNGSTFPSVSSDYLEGLEFPRVGVADQARIAGQLRSQLSEVEKARQATVFQLQDTGILRTRVLAEIFNRLDSVETKVLGDYATTTSGSTPSRGIRQYWQPAEVPWVKTGEVCFSTIRATEEAISRTALVECSLTPLPPNTILVAMYGQGKTRGQTAILDIEATTNQACFAILPNETWEPEFLYYWFMASYQDLRNLSENRGGNQANLNGALLNAVEIPAPDKTEQCLIVQEVKTALSKVATMEQSSKTMLADIEQLPNRVLAQAFES